MRAPLKKALLSKTLHFSMAIANKKEQQNALKDKLLLVTQENTKLLKEIAREKQRQMKLDEDIHAAEEEDKEKKASNNGGSSRTTVNAAEDKAKLLAIAHRQEQEIEQLESEIQSLRTKRGKFMMMVFL
jgi:hypothetical protein